MKPAFFLAVLISQPLLIGAAHAAENYHLSRSQYAPAFETKLVRGNTFIRSQPGLVVPGATLDGDWIIVQGRPENIAASLFGKPITISSTPPVQEKPAPVTNPAQTDRQIAELKLLLAKAVPDPQVTVPPVAHSLPAAPPAVTAATTEPATARSWDIKTADFRLADTFRRWAAESGQFVVRWDAPQHFLVDAESRLSGTAFEAIETALRSVLVHHPEFPIEACIYSGNLPPLVRVTQRGDQASACPN